MTMTVDDNLKDRIDRLEAVLETYEHQSQLLSENEQWYRAVLEDGLGLLCVHDRQGVIASISPAAARTLEYESTELVGRSIVELLPNDFRPFFTDYLERVWKHGVDVGMMRLLSRSGEERIWTYRNVLVQCAGREPQVFGHAQDITALHRARNELRDARSHLEDRVQQRTIEMIEVNRALRQEIAERRQVEAELRSSRERLELFHEVAIRATTCRSRDEIVECVVERCGRAFDDAEVIFAREETSGLIVSNSTLDDPECVPGATVGLKQAYLDQLHAGDLVVSDVAPMLAYPVRDTDRLAGVLIVLGGTSPRTWSDHEIEMVRDVSGFLSLALRRSGAYPAIAEHAA